ncbi:hypothetical protein HPP92_012128 [Vanilla planifolia]|uniref:Uncharacterized protein n=1 Tax=Vanilla planifolia TaxID=51239 RepID=A0A835V1N7_VANPL|nr:hypothetical protein HPP92_012128 [Vanilla planifolia]
MGDIYGVGMEGYGVGMEGYGLGRLKGLSMRREWMGEKGGHPQVLVMGPSNLYAANGAVVILAEKGHFDVAKDVVTQVQEAASGSIFVQMPDVWINLAHVYFAQGVAMQKFSASTLQKSKKTADEVRATVLELKNAVRVFSQLSSASSYHSHGFYEKKIETHVEYCEHLLDAAKVHCEAAEREEQQNRQRLEVARQLERRKQEDELERVMQQEEHFERIKEDKLD